MGSNTFKIVTGIMFPPLGAYYAMRAVGMPSWASTALMGIGGGGLGIALAGAQVSQMLAGHPGAPSLPSLTAGGGGSPTYGNQGIATGDRT